MTDGYVENSGAGDECREDIEAEAARMYADQMALAVKCGAMLCDHRAEIARLAVAAQDGKLRGRFLSETEETVIKYMAAYCHGLALTQALERHRAAYLEQTERDGE